MLVANLNGSAPTCAARPRQKVQRVVSASREGVETDTPGLQSAVFLDRDGVLNRLANIREPEDLDAHLIPSSVKALVRLGRETDLPIILVSNQSKGKEEQNRAVMRRLRKVVKEAGGRLDVVYYSPDKPGLEPPPGEECGRKPAAGMFLKAARDFAEELDLADSYMVGDMTTDIAAGQNAHPEMTTILVKTGFAGRDAKAEATPDRVCRNFAQAVDWILRDHRERGQD